jgi:hypothetical protein
MFIAALLTMAKLWKQPRCPTTDEWIKNMWYLHNNEFSFSHKKRIKFYHLQVNDGTGEHHLK